jgi:hypothetical protein
VNTGLSPVTSSSDATLFVSKGYARYGAAGQSRGSVNVFARRCLNCELPLNASANDPEVILVTADIDHTIPRQ